MLLAEVIHSHDPINSSHAQGHARGNEKSREPAAEPGVSLDSIPQTALITHPGLWAGTH